MTVEYIIQGIIAILLAVISFFLKKLYDKVEEHDDSISTMKEKNAVRDERMLDMGNEIKRNYEMDAERWKEQKKLMEEMREIRSNNKDSLNQIDNKISKQNLVLILIAEKLGVGEVVKNMMSS